MPTRQEVQASIEEHKTNLEQAQQQFDELTQQLIEAELNGSSDIEQLREAQFNLRLDLRSEEETLKYLSQLLTQVKRDAALDQYRQFIRQHLEGTSKRRLLREQIDKLKVQLRPLEKEYEDTYQPVNWLASRIREQRELLIKQYEVFPEELDIIKREFEPTKAESENVTG